MWRLTAAALLVLFALDTAACKSRRRSKVNIDEGDGVEMASAIRTAEPRHAVQLIKGFHEVENGWRWTQANFALALRVPGGAASRGGEFALSVTVPDSVMQRAGAPSLSCQAGGVALDPETFSKPGDYTYRRAIPAAALSAQALTFECSLTKFIASGVLEERELGVIALSAALTSK
jgi:hypothetical protein